MLQLPHRAEDNGHWTRNLIANADGSKIYVSVGSASNIADYGIEAEEGRAAIWEMNPDGSEARVFASGLRNPVGMSWSPESGALWVSVNERDMLGGIDRRGIDLEIECAAEGALDLAFGHDLDEMIVAKPVGDQVGDGCDLEAMAGGESDEVGKPRHGPVVIHDLADHAGGIEPGKPREVRKFCTTVPVRFSERTMRSLILIR